MRITAYIVSVCAATTIACASGGASPAAPLHPLVLQGAMDAEVRTLVSALQNRSETRVGGWTFWSGTLDGYPVVVSKTMKGMSNAAAATAIAVERYQPVAIINQGTAGGHQPDLHVLDIVLGVESVNLGAIKTAFRTAGTGVNTEDWKPLDLLRTEGSAGMDPLALTMRRFRGDGRLLDVARSVRSSYSKGRVVDGVIGSADVWNSELDRIARFHREFGTSVEEMETASAAQVAASFQIPFLGIRVLSNNITDGETYDRNAGEACQAFVLDVARANFRHATSSVP
jgi:adenosylhomocysteine nucleosidase